MDPALVLALYAQVAITRISQTGWLKLQIFSHSAGNWDVQYEGPGILMSNEDLLPGLQMATFLSYPQMVESGSSGLFIPLQIL